MRSNLKVIFFNGEDQYTIPGYFNNSEEGIKTIYVDDTLFSEVEVSFTFDTKDELNLFLNKLKTYEQTLDAIVLDYTYAQGSNMYRYVTSYGHLDTKFYIGEITYKIYDSNYYQVEVLFMFVDNEIEHISENKTETRAQAEARGKKNVY